MAASDENSVYMRSVEHALYDNKLPAYVRAFLVIASLDATSKLICKEAGITPAVYARYEGKPCRVTLVSSMGDIGIAFAECDYGYSKRGLSVYDLTDFSPTSLF